MGSRVESRPCLFMPCCAAGREGSMPFIRLLWRLARRRWVRRVLFWIVVRLIRLFGWRRAVRLLVRGRGRWRLVALGVWRATVRLIRVGRPDLLLIGWLRGRATRSLGDGMGHTSRSSGSPRRRRLRAADAVSIIRDSRGLRTRLPSRLAHRRDDLRRSILAAVGVDPEWRPPSRRVGGASAIGRESPPEIGGATSQ